MAFIVDSDHLARIQGEADAVMAALVATQAAKAQGHGRSREEAAAVLAALPVFKDDENLCHLDALSCEEFVHRAANSPSHPYHASAVDLRRLLAELVEDATPRDIPVADWGCPVRSDIAGLVRAIQEWEHVVLPGRHECNAVLREWWVHYGAHADVKSFVDAVCGLQLAECHVISMQDCLQWLTDREFGSMLDHEQFVGFMASVLDLFSAAFLNEADPTMYADPLDIPTIPAQFVSTCVAFLVRCKDVLTAEGATSPVVLRWYLEEGGDVDRVNTWWAFSHLVLHTLAMDPALGGGGSGTAMHHTLAEAVVAVAEHTMGVHSMSAEWGSSCDPYAVPLWLMHSMVTAPHLLQAFLSLVFSKPRALAAVLLAQVTSTLQLAEHPLYADKVESARRLVAQVQELAPGVAPELQALLQGHAV